MTEGSLEEKDAWTQWLLKARYLGNPEYAKETLRYLRSFRDSVLDNAKLNGKEEFFLDVGSGDGLIAFGALERMKNQSNSTAKVIFLDTSKSLLEHCRQISTNIPNPKPDCIFVQGSAEYLPFKDGSIDVITTRSVLVYIQDKRSTIKEFYRTLREKTGRISLFEPIFGYFDDNGEDLNRYFACNVSEISDIATKIRDFYRSLKPPKEKDSKLNFNERDLISACEVAGFTEALLQLHLILEPQNKALGYESYLSIPPFPNVPSMKEVMKKILSTDEIERFENVVRPQIDQHLGLKHHAAHSLIYAMK